MAEEIPVNKLGKRITPKALASMRANAEKARAAFKEKMAKGEIHWPKRSKGIKKSEAPNVLEYGGDTVVFRRRGGKLTSQKVKIAPRPYMAPALEKERPQLPKRWGGSVRGG